jgi:hypothetical protein
MRLLDVRGTERRAATIRPNRMPLSPVQPQQREGHIASAAEGYEDFFVRKELDAFFKATERWHLTSAERRALLGVSSEDRWLHCLHDLDPHISPDELARVRVVIQIDETLAMCVSDPRDMALWFRTLKIVPPFFGRTPLALLFRDMAGFKAIADYLSAWHLAKLESERH